MSPDYLANLVLLRLRPCGRVPMKPGTSRSGSSLTHAFSRRLSRWHVALGAAMLLNACDRTRPSGAALAYPETRTVNVTNNYHGTIVADPYRWLEDLKSPEVLACAARQHQLAQSQLRTPLRDWIHARMKKYGSVSDGVEAAMAQSDDPAAIRLGFDPSGTHRVLTVRGADGQAGVLVDGGTLGAGRDIARLTASPDGRVVAYGIPEGGSDWVDTRIVDVETGAESPEVVEGMVFETPEWTRDNKGFFYVKNERPREGSGVMFRAPSVRYHTVGTPQANDRIIFSTPDESTDLVLRAEVPGRGQHALIYEGAGAAMDGIGWSLTRVHVLDLQNPAAPRVNGALQALSPARDAAYTTLGSDGSVLHVLTDHGAPRRRIVAVDLRAPEPKNWRTIVSESKSVMQSVRVVDGRFVVQSLTNLQNSIAVFDRRGRKLQDHSFPPMSSVAALSSARKADIQFTTSTFLRGPQVWNLNVVTGELRSVYSAPIPFDTLSFETEQMWYPSRDGTRIPMFLVHRKGLALDGSHPVLMYGYGSSGTVVAPGFSEDVLAWLDLGGIYAQPSLRGGGEFGRAWYDAAILDRKQTTFDDCIAAAEYLIGQKYTSPGKLGIRGASNGGLLVTAGMTQRPDLFAAVVAELPWTDNMRYDRGRHRAQYGSPKDSSQFEFLSACSPQHRLKKATCYPATLTRTSLNDDRGPAWMAMKFTAALQASQSCPHPALLLAYPTGGHLGGRSPTTWMEDAADALAFVAQAVGIQDPATQP